MGLYLLVVYGTTPIIIVLQENTLQALQYLLDSKLVRTARVLFTHINYVSKPYLYCLLKY